MNKYLLNDICDFEIFFNYDNNSKYNILSTCFFKMNNHYKNFNIYINGLKNLIKLLETQSKYILRIFIDEHIKSDENIFNILKSSNKVEIILFKCRDYISDKYHIDLFATLVRLFPLFNFENNDALDTIIVDVDLNDEDIIKLKNIMKYSTDIKEIIGMGTVDKFIINRLEPHFFCGLIAFYNCKFDKNIIINFIKNAPKIFDKGLYGKRISTFGYGTDELFLNKYFLYEDNYKNLLNIKIGIFLNYDINWFLYYYKKDLILENSSNTYKYLKFILGKFYKKNMNLEKMFDTIDKLIYQIIPTNINKIYISKRFYKLIKYLNSKNLEWFDLDHIKLIYKYFLNVIQCFSIIYFKPENLYIYNIKNIIV